jgi:hypothetical protein
MSFRPRLTGREGCVLFSTTTPVIPTTNHAAVNLAAWIAASIQTQDVADVDMEFPKGLEEHTSRKAAATFTPELIMTQGGVIIRFTCPYYAWDTPVDIDGNQEFPLFVRQYAMTDAAIGLVFLESIEDQSAGIAGNFQLQASKTEPLRGLQTLAVSAVATGYVEWVQNVTQPGATPPP